MCMEHSTPSTREYHSSFRKNKKQLWKSCYYILQLVFFFVIFQRVFFSPFTSFFLSLSFFPFLYFYLSLFPFLSLSFSLFVSLSFFPFLSLSFFLSFSPSPSLSPCLYLPNCKSSIVISIAPKFRNSGEWIFNRCSALQSAFFLFLFRSFNLLMILFCIHSLNVILNNSSKIHFKYRRLCISFMFNQNKKLSKMLRSLRCAYYHAPFLFCFEFHFWFSLGESSEFLFVSAKFLYARAKFGFVQAKLDFVQVKFGFIFGFLGNPFCKKLNQVIILSLAMDKNDSFPV